MTTEFANGGRIEPSEDGLPVIGQVAPRNCVVWVTDDEQTRERLRGLIDRQAAALADGSITSGVLATLVLNALTSEDGHG